MLLVICLWWIGIQLSAPTWFYVLLGISASVKLILYGANMYNKGKKAGVD